MATVETPAAPVEAPDPFQGKETTFEEFSNFRKDGTVPERFKPAAAEPAPPETKVETVEGQGPSETEQEKQERERDEAGKFKAKDKEPLFTPEQQKAFDRAFAKREAKLRAEFDQRFAAQTSVPPQVQPPAQKAPAAVEESNEPLPPAIPNLNTWSGTIEEYNSAVEQYPAKLKAYFDAQRQMEQQTHAIQSRLTENEQATLKAHPDYKEAFDDLATDIRNGEQIPLPPHILQAIAEDSEDPHGLTYHLAKNREEFQRLAAITDPVDGLRQVLKLEARLQSKTAPVPAKKPSQTAAPTPPDPVGARATATAFDVNDEKLSSDEWARQRNEQVAKRRH